MYLYQLQYSSQILVRDERVLGPYLGVAALGVPVDFKLLDDFFRVLGFVFSQHCRNVRHWARTILWGCERRRWVDIEFQQGVASATA